eukprot:415437-Rhodomonas_salina.1
MFRVSPSISCLNQEVYFSWLCSMTSHMELDCEKCEAVKTGCTFELLGRPRMGRRGVRDTSSREPMEPGEPFLSL